MPAGCNLPERPDHAFHLTSDQGSKVSGPPLLSSAKLSLWLPHSILAQVPASLATFKAALQKVGWGGHRCLGALAVSGRGGAPKEAC